MNWMERLKQVAECRAARGQRQALWLLLRLIILGAMMGEWGDRPFAELVETYGEQ